MCSLASRKCLNVSRDVLVRALGPELRTFPRLSHLRQRRLGVWSIPNDRRRMSTSCHSMSEHPSREHIHAVCDSRVDTGEHTLAGYTLSPDASSVFIATRTGELHALIARTGERRWSHDVGQQIRKLYFVNHDGTMLYLATADRYLHGFDTLSGKSMWIRKMVSDPKVAIMSPDGGSLLLGTDSGELLAIVAKSGTTKWIHNVGETVPDDWTFCITPDGASVVFWASDGHLHALSAATGEEKWRYDPGSVPCHWHFSVTPDGATLFFSRDRNLEAISAINGKCRWISDLGEEGSEVSMSTPYFATVQPDGTKVYVGSIGRLQALGVTSGEKLWTRSIGNSELVASVPSPDGATMFVVAGDDRIHAVDTSSGDVKWSYDGANSSVIEPLTIDAHGDKVFVWTLGGGLVALSAHDGKLIWTCGMEEPVPQPRASSTRMCLSRDGALLLYSHDMNALYASVADSGEMSWKKSARTLRPNLRHVSVGDGPEVLSSSNYLRRKRLAVLGVLFAVICVRQSGWLHRRGGKDQNAALEEVLGKPLASLMSSVLGLPSSDTVDKSEEAQ